MFVSSETITEDPAGFFYSLTTSSSTPVVSRNKRTVNTYLWRRQQFFPRAHALRSSSRLADNQNKHHSKTRSFKTKNINAGAKVVNNQRRHFEQIGNGISKIRSSHPRIPLLLAKRFQGRDLLHEHELVNTILRRDRIVADPHLHLRKKRGVLRNLQTQKRLRQERRSSFVDDRENEIEDFTEIKDANGRKIFDRYEEAENTRHNNRLVRPVVEEAPRRPNPRYASSGSSQRAFTEINHRPKQRTVSSMPKKLYQPVTQKAYRTEPILQSPQSQNVFQTPMFKFLNVPIKCMGKFAEMSQPIVTEAIPKMIRFSTNTFGTIAQKVKRNSMGPGVRRRHAVRPRRPKRDVSSEQPGKSQVASYNLDVLMSFLVPFLQNPTGYLASFLTPNKVNGNAKDNLVEVRTRRSLQEDNHLGRENKDQESNKSSKYHAETKKESIEQDLLSGETRAPLLEDETECEVEYKAVKTKTEEILDHIQLLLNLDFVDTLPIYKKLIKLQNVKEKLVEYWSTSAFEAQPTSLSVFLKQLETLSDLRDKIFLEVIKSLSPKNSLQNEKWIKMLIRLLKLKCLIYNVLEDISSSKLTSLKEVEYLDFLSNLNFTHFKTPTDALKFLKLDRDEEIENQANLLSRLQLFLHEQELHNSKNIREEAKILWEISNIKKLQRDTILEVGKKVQEGVQIEKELRIIFDLQQQLEDCEIKQSEILKNL